LGFELMGLSVLKNKVLTVSALLLFGVLSLTGCVANLAGTNKDDLAIVDLRENAETIQPTESSEPKDNSYDRFAEIDIDDQSGDGTYIVIESLRVSRVSFLVILDSTGSRLAVSEVSPQSQPVSIELDVRLSRSQELLAKLYVDDGDGIFNSELDKALLDDENESAEEDFDYRLIK
jgi:hypothetical protein